MVTTKRVGLADKAQSFPEELSGGQQQRAAIARAIAMRPKILMLDEPTSALDPNMVGEVLSVIRSLANEGMTMMIVTHEMRFARSVSNRVFYMDEGGIYEEGTPNQIFKNPTREKTRRFISSLKTLNFSIRDYEVDYLTAIARIESFGSSAALPVDTMRRFVLVFEELVLQSVLPHIQEQQTGLPIDVLVEHAETDDRLLMRVSWQGEPYNPLEEADELSRSIVKGSVLDASYRLTDMNEVTVVI